MDDDNVFPLLSVEKKDAQSQESEIISIYVQIRVLMKQKHWQVLSFFYQMKYLKSLQFSLVFPPSHLLIYLLKYMQSKPPFSNTENPQCRPICTSGHYQYLSV